MRASRNITPSPALLSGSTTQQIGRPKVDGNTESRRESPDFQKSSLRFLRLKPQAKNDVFTLGQPGGAARYARTNPFLYIFPIIISTLICINLTGCIRTTPEIVKIGLVAPFEGRYREIGYDVIPAARLAIREYAAESAGSGLAVELVAYDDGGDPEKAIEQAKKLALDPDVVVVIGHWREETTLAAQPIYEEAGLPLITFTVSDIENKPGVYNLAPSLGDLQAAAEQWTNDQQPVPVIDVMVPGDVIEDAERLDDILAAGDGRMIGGPGYGLGQFAALAGDQIEGTAYVTGSAYPQDSKESFLTPETLNAFTAGYEGGNLGIDAGPLAINGYQATWLAIEQAVESEGGNIDITPASELRFETDGRRIDAPVYVYQWVDGERVNITN